MMIGGSPSDHRKPRLALSSPQKTPMDPESHWFVKDTRRSLRGATRSLLGSCGSGPLALSPWCSGSSHWARDVSHLPGSLSVDLSGYLWHTTSLCPEMGGRSHAVTDAQHSKNAHHARRKHKLSPLERDQLRGEQGGSQHLVKRFVEDTSQHPKKTSENLLFWWSAKEGT